MSTQDLSALFQGMGNAQPALAQMMGGSQPEAPPDLSGGAPPLAAPVPNQIAPDDKLRMQIDSLTKQIQDGIAQVKQPVQDALPDALKDFDTYNEQRYQQAYGGGGALGTAGRALANLLSGFAHKGQTIKERLTEENRKDWEAAVKAAQIKVQQEKADQVAAIQQQAQLLNTLKSQQQAQQFQQTLGVQQQKVDLSAQNTPSAKDAEEKKRRAEVATTFSDPNEQKYYIANGKLPPPVKESEAPFATAKRTLEAQLGRPLTSDELVRLNQHLRFNPYDITREQIVVGPDNEYHTVPLTSTKAPLAPIVQSPASPTNQTAGVNKPAGRDLGFGKPLTPNQQLDNELKLGALDNTISIAKNIRAHTDLLQSLITSKKIQFQIDPQQGIIKALVNREVPLTKEEAQLAADFESLTEHINTLRGPLGATGFRGAAAWNALQGQAGNPMANPEITKRVLDRTLTALQTQRDVRAKKEPKSSKPKPKVWNPQTGKFD